MVWTYAINAEIYNTLENNPVVHLYNICMLYFVGEKVLLYLDYSH